MDSRRNIPPAYDEHHLRQASGMMRHVPHHHIEPLPSPLFLENKLAAQAEEIERLAGDNRRLASSHISLRQDLVVAQQESENIREHIKNTQNEGDIQIRILLDKIKKMEADIRNGNNIKDELHEAHNEARSLVTDRMELTAKIQLATKELDKCRADVKKLPEMRAELDSLRQEHQRLRKTFEYEKGINVEKVEQMKELEKDLIGLAAEVERLRAEVSNAEKKASAPIANSGQYELTSENIYPPPPYHGNGGYAESFSIPQHHLHPYGGGGFAVGPQVYGGPVGGVDGGGGGGFAVGAQVIGGTGVDAGGNPVWGGAVYDKPHAQM